MATLKQIAQEVGVDISTVSCALNGKAAQRGISAARIAQIETAARRMGYQPNVAARAVRDGRFGTIALLQSTRWGVNHIPGDLLASIEIALGQRDLRLLFTRLPDDQLTDEQLVPKLLRELCCDGLVISYNELIPKHLLRLIRKHHLPSVWVNSKQEADCVHPDEYAAAQLAVVRLLKLGHRRIAYVRYGGSDADSRTVHFSRIDRRAGCEDAVRAAGLKPLPGLPGIPPGGPIDPDSQIAAAMRFLSSPTRPTAVMCYSGSDAEAIGIAALKLGLSLPGDLSLICISDTQPRVLDLPIDTLLIPNQEMGELAVAMLIAKIAMSERSLAPRAVPHRSAAGRSCAPPAAR